MLRRLGRRYHHRSAAGQPAHDDVDGLPSSEQEVSSGTSLRWESVRYSGASNTVADRNFLGQVSASRYRGQPIPCFLMRQLPDRPERAQSDRQHRQDNAKGTMSQPAADCEANSIFSPRVD
ncbi:unnamed protein product [Peronospora belbahrii]|uniref:Uncharacterized protein n=1 Tax=Peronospora belbahrii TaxID=622444 RepID=A0ABN8CS29_9STRA|nr:unnamed protein product [Peronospora belbahrii]